MKKILFFTVLFVSLFIINNLVHSIYNLWQKQDLMVQAQKDLAKEKQKNTELRKKLAQAESQEFIEQEARNKLFMVKPGEVHVVLPKSVLEASDSAKHKPQDTRENWEKWRDLFFKS